MIDLMYITDSFPFINGPMYKLYDNEVIKVHGNKDNRLRLSLRIEMVHNKATCSTVIPIYW